MRFRHRFITGNHIAVKKCKPQIVGIFPGQGAGCIRHNMDGLVLTLPLEFFNLTVHIIICPANDIAYRFDFLSRFHHVVSMQMNLYIIIMFNYDYAFAPFRKAADIPPFGIIKSDYCINAISCFGFFLK